MMLCTADITVTECTSVHEGAEVFGRLLHLSPRNFEFEPPSTHTMKSYQVYVIMAKATLSFAPLCIGYSVSLTAKPEESALRFSDCNEISLIVEGADNRLHCHWTAILDRPFFCDFT